MSFMRHTHADSFRDMTLIVLAHLALGHLLHVLICFLVLRAIKVVFLHTRACRDKLTKPVGGLRVTFCDSMHLLVAVQIFVASRGQPFEVT